MLDRWLNVRQDEATSNPDVWILVEGDDSGSVTRHNMLLRFNRSEDSQWLIDQLRRCANELEALL